MTTSYFSKADVAEIVLGELLGSESAVREAFDAAKNHQLTREVLSRLAARIGAEYDDGQVIVRANTKIGPVHVYVWEDEGERGLGIQHWSNCSI